jgi:hypothetical protein
VDDHDFPARVSAADEVFFTRDGFVNFHNVLVFLIGPHELPAQLTGASYYHFLHDDLPLLLDKCIGQYAIKSTSRAQQLWFLHDGASPHYSRQIRDFLNRIYPRR